MTKSFSSFFISLRNLTALNEIDWHNSCLKKSFARRRINLKTHILDTLTLLAFVIMIGCSATEVKPGAERIVVTHQPAPRGCRFVGNIVGEQGGSFTGKWTSNKNLQVGALNDMKNKAHEMGANYVVLENTNAGNTTSGSAWGMSGGQTDVTHMGTAYRCSPRLIGQM